MTRTTIDYYEMLAFHFDVTSISHRIQVAFKQMSLLSPLKTCVQIEEHARTQAQPSPRETPTEPLGSHRKSLKIKESLVIESGLGAHISRF